MKGITATVSGDKFETNVTSTFRAVVYDGADYLLFTWDEDNVYLLPYLKTDVIDEPGMTPSLGIALSRASAVKVSRKDIDFVVN